MEQRLRTTTESGQGEPRPATPSSGSFAREGGGLELWQQREEGLTHRVSELTGHVEALERRLRLLDERRRLMDVRPARPVAEDEGIARRVQELEEALYRREQGTGWRSAFQEFADMGLTPSEVTALARRMARVSRDQGLSVQDIQQRLLTALENGSGAPTGREEMAALEAQERHLRAAIASLRREKEDLERRIPEAREMASLEVQRAGEDAAASVREGAVLMRSQLDTLLQDAMDIAGRAARVDADLRSKEWLGKLLALLEGKDLPAQDVRALGLTIIESLLLWVEQHPEQATPLVKEDLERALKAFQGWAGSP
ncbi:MAG: hypothetical protein HY681_02590 [Chloroflexi bacterium]|nr:hypothetical protein [Chloroflexota bacterium]